MKSSWIFYILFHVVVSWKVRLKPIKCYSDLVVGEPMEIFEQRVVGSRYEFIPIDGTLKKIANTGEYQVEVPGNIPILLEFRFYSTCPLRSSEDRPCRVRYKSIGRPRHGADVTELGSSNVVQIDTFEIKNEPCPDLTEQFSTTLIPTTIIRTTTTKTTAVNERNVTQPEYVEDASRFDLRPEIFEIVDHGQYDHFDDGNTVYPNVFCILLVVLMIKQ
ncbi:unnamed protein product [Bursaphelenchus xylophilus]|uniref:(pine wood nematode) hypothetical protein n=1 Tax=Bursaphelenchus xylophilus TaxID=6326 RepID=A0A1I7RZ54_BURXY|nr:unnamed protein product [Bursaphelenchus xylophilus]CAG9106840.1 unnamed protein product [Bursaphelenchus xylophilus]